MAGIGFRFRELVTEGTYLDVFRGYVYSAIFAAGPWILTMAVIASLNFLAPKEVQGIELKSFRSLLSYIYAFSLVLVGTFQLPMTRYIADRIYEKNRGEVLSTFIGSMFFFTALSFAASSIFLYFNTGGAVFKILAMMLFAVITMIWNAMIFLTSIRDYKFIIFTFLTGGLATVSLSWVLKLSFGLNGYLCGYFIGHLFLLTGLIREITREFHAVRGASYKFLGYNHKYLSLFFAGFTYSLGIWADKLLVWNHYSKEVYFGNLKVYSSYDVSIFIACLTIIPAMSYFLTKIETGFYELYRDYFACILNKLSLESIENARDAIIKIVDASIFNLIKFQGAITLFCFIYADRLMLAAGNPEGLDIFKYSIIAVFFHILFLFTTIFMMYFEYYRSYLCVSAVFLLSNAVLTKAFLAQGCNPVTGYLFTSVICFMIAYLSLKYNLSRLLYYTFMEQPITSQPLKNATFDALKFLGANGVRDIARDERFSGLDMDAMESGD